jgi:hypothetical protein
MRQRLNKEPEGLDRPAENIVTMPRRHHLSVPDELDLEVRKHVIPEPPVRREGMTLPNQKCDVNPLRGNGIGWREDPAGEDRLDNLKSVRNPVDTLKQSIIAHARMGRVRKPENDFRLDTRFGKAGQRELRVERG